MTIDFSQVAGELFCYLTTTGRNSGCPPYHRDLVCTQWANPVSALRRAGAVRLGQKCLAATECDGQDYQQSIHWPCAACERPEEDRWCADFFLFDA